MPASVVVAITLAAFLATSVAARPDGVPLALGAAIDRIPEGTVVFDDDAVSGWLLLERTGPTAALVPDGEALATALPEKLGWRVEEQPDGYTLLVAPKD